MTRAAIALLFIYLFTSTDGGALSLDSVLNLSSSSNNKNTPTIILIKNENSDDSRSKYDIESSSDKKNYDIIYVNADYDDTVDIHVMKKDKFNNYFNRNNNKIQEILKTFDRVMSNNQISHENNYHTINAIDNNYIVTNDNFDRLTNNDNNAFTYEDYRDSALYGLKNLIYKDNFKDKFRTSNKGSIQDKSKQQRQFHVAKPALRHQYGYVGETEEQPCKNSNLKLGMTLRPASYRPYYANDDCKS